MMFSWFVTREEVLCLGYFPPRQVPGRARTETASAQKHSVTQERL